MIWPQTAKVLAALPLISLATAATPICPPNGPWIPRPTDLGKSAILRSATHKLTGLIDDALKGKIEAGWPVKNASFSISLVSSDDHVDGRSIWEYHHRAEANTKGPRYINGDSQYLIGSISKMISELLFLRVGINMDQKITEFLPELGDDSSLIPWKEISLAALAEHLSGMPPNSGFSEYYYLKDVFEQLGFPHIQDSDYLNCGVIALNEACTRDVLLKDMLTYHPVVAPNTRPVYSQLSFTLLSYAFQAHTGKNYTQLLDEYLIQPLKLPNFGASPGNDERAVIPPGDNSWGSDYGDNAPGGGLFSSTNDLARILHGILKKTILPTPSDVDRWLKPRAVSTDPYMSIGAPWEIMRLRNVVPDHPRDVEVYTKGGGAYGYTSHLGLIDDYGIGLTLLTAGPGVSLNVLMDAVYATIIPAVDAEARSQATQYTGVFSTTTHNQYPTTANTKLTITQDDSPGLRITNLTRDGANILDSILLVWNMTTPQVGNLEMSNGFRIFPAGISQPAPKHSFNHNLMYEDWRINLDISRADATNSPKSDLPGQGTFDGFCGSWQSADWIYYGSEAIDRIVFVRDKRTGKVVGAEVPFLRAVMERN